MVSVIKPARRVTTTRLQHALLASLISIGNIASPVAAQEITDSSVPPSPNSVDENAVDLATGRIVISSLEQPEITVGDGDNKLVYRRYGASNTSYGMILTSPAGYTNVTAQVTAGDTSVLMVNSITGYKSAMGGPETAVNSPDGRSTKVTLKDGTVFTVSLDAYSLSGGDYPNQGLVTNVTRPSGEQINYIYLSNKYCVYGQCSIFASPRLIYSNRGYGFYFDVSVGPNGSLPTQSVQSVNILRDGCSTISGNCTSLTSGRPKLTFSDFIDRSIHSVTTDTSGKTTALNYDNDGNLLDVQTNGKLGNIKYNYDDYFQDLQSVTRNGQTWGYSIAKVDYPTIGPTTTVVTDPTGGKRTFVSDRLWGSPLSVTNEMGSTTSFTYDGVHRLSTRTDPVGNVSRYSYDTRGNVTETRLVSAVSGISDIVSAATFPSTCANTLTCNKPTSTINARGGQTDFIYDPTHGGPLSVTSPAATNGVRPQTRYAYTALQAYFSNSGGTLLASGQPLQLLTSTSICRTGVSCSGTADESRTTISYGPQTAGTGNTLAPITVTIAAVDGSLAATTSMTYDDVGNVQTIDGPLAGNVDITRYRYDAARRLVGVIGPDPDGAGPLKPRAQRFTYNLDGQRTLAEVGTVTDQSDTAWSAFNSLQQATTTYDGSGRTTQQTTTAGGITYTLSQSSYDALGRSQCTVTRMDPAQWNTQTAACVPQTTGPNGPDRVTRTIYDAASQVIKVQSAVGTSDTSDEASYGYTPNGKVATLTDANGNLTTYEYDGFDRLVKTRYPLAATAGSSSTTDYEALTLDPGGNVTQRRLRDGQAIAYTYDALNRLTLKHVPTGAWLEADVSYGYDNLGRLTSVANPGNWPTNVGFVRDALGRITTESSYYGAKTMQYDLVGRMINMAWPDGFNVNYAYLTTGEVRQIAEGVGTPGMVLANYSYDDLGRRTLLFRGNYTTTSYAYDAMSRLTSMTHDLNGTSADVTLSFTYNPASQIASTTRSNDAYAWNGHYNVDRPYAVNGLNQLAATGSGASTAAIGYDGRGNLATSQGNQYRYTSENRLAEIVGVNVSQFYDGLGRMFDYNEYNAGGVDTRFDYLGGHIISELSTNGTLLRRMVWGPGDDEPLTSYEGSGTSGRGWWHADERGSTIAISDVTAWAYAINRYDEYGIPQTIRASDGFATIYRSTTGRYGYTGQAWLPALGLYSYKARVYSPTLGRFLQTDPIGYSDGPNWYNYVGSDPIDLRDPSGECGALNDACVVTAQKDFTTISLGILSVPASASRSSRGNDSSAPQSKKAGAGPGAGMGDNGPPVDEITADDIVVTAIRATATTVRVLLLRVGGTVIPLVIPAAAGETPETLRNLPSRLRQKTLRTSTEDRSDELRRLRASQTAKEQADRIKDGKNQGWFGFFYNLLRTITGN